MATTKPQRKSRGRPSSFDRQELLRRVMELFWLRGYHGLSFNEIAQETGLTRASLYNAFETKEALFLEAFEHYFAEHAPDKPLRDVMPGQPVGPALYQMLSDAAASYMADEKRRGCMGVNCMNELMSEQTPFGMQIAQMYESYKARLQALMQQAIAQKELAETTNPEVTANIIFAFMNGFSVFSKSNCSPQKLRAMAKQFVQQLGFDISEKK